MASFTMQRECRICGAAIGDDNPDGIGATCREVWGRAKWSTYYHFRGLDSWKLKLDIWLPAFIEAFGATKFRSGFRKEFFASISERYKTGQPISSKQLNIVKEMLVGSPYAMGAAKLDRYAADILYDREKQVIQDDFHAWFENAGDDAREYMVNCAKKFYGEARQAV